MDNKSFIKKNSRKKVLLGKAKIFFLVTIGGIIMATVSQAKTYHIDNELGDLTIRNTSSSKASIRVEGDPQSLAKVRIEERADGFHVVDIFNSQHLETSNCNSVSRLFGKECIYLHIIAEVPQDWDIHLSSSVGSVTLDGLNNDVEAQTRIGEINLLLRGAAATQRKLSLKTGTGDIIISGLSTYTYDVQAETRTGDIEIGSGYQVLYNRNRPGSYVSQEAALGSGVPNTQYDIRAETGVGSVEIR